MYLQIFRLRILLLGNQERGQQAKTGGNQGVIVDATWLSRILIALKSNISGREQMFPLEVTKFRRLWWQAVEHLQLAGVGPPHRLRHSRPSQDAISGARSLEEIRRRGRWASVKSVQRYSEAHSLVAARARVPDEVMAHASGPHGVGVESTWRPHTAAVRQVGVWALLGAVDRACAALTL